MTKRRSLLTSLAILVDCAIGIGVFLMFWYMVAHSSPVPLPPVIEPTPLPTPAPDSGFHMALDPHGDVYQIDLPYAEMGGTQRDDANRFGRLYPDGC